MTGSGFDPNANNGFGIYVVFGPKNADYATNAERSRRRSGSTGTGRPVPARTG